MDLLAGNGRLRMGIYSLIYGCYMHKPSRPVSPISSVSLYPEQKGGFWLASNPTLAGDTSAMTNCMSDLIFSTICSLHSRQMLTAPL
jgi:hypothetical protein